MLRDIRLIKQAVHACMATDPKLQDSRANRTIEDTQLIPIVIGVGLADMHGFSKDKIMNLFNIEFESDFENKLKHFKGIMAMVVREMSRSGKLSDFPARFIRKVDLTQRYIYDRMSKEFYPIENFVF